MGVGGLGPEFGQEINRKEESRVKKDQAKLRRSADASRTKEQDGKWLLKGYNSTLQPEPWFDLGEADTQKEIEDKAEKMLCEFRDGARDQLFIIRPDGTAFRFA